MVRQTATHGITRRHFLKATAATATGAWAFSIVPSTIFGATAPSERVSIGMIGVGNMGSSNLKGFMGNPGFQVVAVCDVDRFYRDSAIKAAKLTDKDGYNDFRELLAHKDVDAVCVSTPDHWHAIPTIAAAKAGKDIYCEKPLSLTIAEGRAMVAAAKRYGRVLQTGSMQRSDARFLQACELVRNGHIGDVKQVFVDIPGNNKDNPLDWKEEPVPDGFDYNFWMGQAPQAPYTKMRCHYTFRFILDYSGGQMTNWGAHYLDIAQWGLGTDDTGPVKIKGKGEFPKAGLFTTALKADITYTYANGAQLILHQEKGGNTKFVGTKGSVSVNRDRIETDPVSLAEYKTSPDEIHLIRSVDHKKNFLECIKNRQNPICHAEVGHRSASLCHLGNVSMLLNHELNWDPVKEKFVNDPEADAMISRNMRAPWTL